MTNANSYTGKSGEFPSS